MPIDTLKINTDDSWEYSLSTQDKKANDWKKVNKANQFGLEKSQWYEMESTLAEPVWVSDKDNADSLTVIFQKEITFDGILKEGIIKFIAPDVATVKLNDKELSTDYQLNYDPDSKLVFAGQVTLDPANLIQGKNILQIIVNNKSQWKGVVAEIV